MVIYFIFFNGDNVFIITLLFYDAIPEYSDDKF